MERSPGLSSVWGPTGGRGAPGGGGEHLSSLQDVCRINHSTRVYVRHPAVLLNNHHH